MSRPQPPFDALPGRPSPTGADSPPIPPPPDDRYVIVGMEGKQHTVTLAQVRRWAEHRQISATTQVFSFAKREWRRAANFPEIAGALGHPRQRAFTQLALWGIAVAVLAFMLEFMVELSHSYTLLVFGLVLAFVGLIGAIASRHDEHESDENQPTPA